ncbi:MULTISPECIES: TetR/AcrR family transcriptional regulator [unclassified Pseudofrankia]|uniref:TetR/AcrR family transcriptional regulator n=1 Tax=unclassified Pseudofrankia TaxID=2994372 RepID=UPI0008D95F35|nr:MULTISPECIES: TetR/AcrR family transcriptional regulator [unclassified Pseudofrankia]MDT3439890.1 TetR/AcrR family transcriptional regulator [Pseudofrankia sp. BMG5.37]OHV48464.1 TetR family transcriptional regulator [Pseudofrankia sp. BMG5.36]
MPVVAPSTKEQIVRVAEQLFALHGIEGVSLRQIGAAAGSGNNSAVQYHFGSKDELIRAIFEYRLAWLHERRMLLIAERRPDDLRSWLECQLRVVMEQSERPGSHYLSFVGMLRQYGRRDVFEQLPDEIRQSAVRFQERLSGILPHIAEPLRPHRISWAMTFMVQAAADRELARAADRPVVPFAVAVTDLLDGLVGFLSAPVSPATLAALDDTDPASLIWPPFL